MLIFSFCSWCNQDVPEELPDNHPCSQCVREMEDEAEKFDSLEPDEPDPEMSYADRMSEGW